jgi:hypothetical protein
MLIDRGDVARMQPTIRADGFCRCLRTSSDVSMLLRGFTTAPVLAITAA